MLLSKKTLSIHQHAHTFQHVTTQHTIQKNLWHFVFITQQPFDDQSTSFPSFPKARCIFKLSWVDTGVMVRSIYDPDFVPSFGAQRISHTIFQHVSRSVVVSIGTSDTGIQASVQTKNSNQVLSKYDQMSQVVWLFVEWNKNQQAQLYTSYIYILSNIPLHTYIYKAVSILVKPSRVRPASTNRRSGLSGLSMFGSSFKCWTQEIAYDICINKCIIYVS